MAHISILVVSVVVVGVIVTYWSMLSGALRGFHTQYRLLAVIGGLALITLLGTFFYLILSIAFAGTINAGGEWGCKIAMSCSGSAEKISALAWLPSAKKTSISIAFSTT